MQGTVVVSRNAKYGLFWGEVQWIGFLFQASKVAQFVSEEVKRSAKAKGTVCLSTKEGKRQKEGKRESF